uniref:TTF-type domain-containing protein n=1 Tax=Sander lucioperca TaxID=283035 RepID=A0A8C9YGK0_SANLU
MFSPSNGNIYCFACKLFSKKHNQFVEGFSDWKHSERIGDHEKSDVHRSCMLALHQRCKGTATIDSSLLKQMEGARQYWREVLKRVVAVIKFFGERGLAFRGDNELLGSPLNGNYLGILELIAQFDPFLKKLQTVADEIREAKYFSVVVDSTPDLSHVDQLTFIFRFVDKKGKVVERFLAFEPIESHTGENLAECVVAMVESLGLELSNCRGQSYDNASNMSGKYNGLQAHLKKRNPLIHYVPCTAHSLNLVGVNTIEASSPEVGNYFTMLQSLYTFCSSSTNRWGKVFRNTDGIGLTLKSLSGTRWSCRADATKALSKNYAKIKEALANIASSDEEKRDTRHEAGVLCAKLKYLETVFMAFFWDTILDRFQATSIMLQKSDINILTAVNLLESLRAFVSTQRDQFEMYEKAALNVTGVLHTYKCDLQRSRKRKTFGDEGSEPKEDPSNLHGGRKKFQTGTFYVVIDKLVSCLDHRLSAYKELTDIFGVLFMPETTSNSEVTKHANALLCAYPSDLNSSFANELIQFRSFMCEQDKSPSKMLNTVLELGLQSVFPNVYVALRMFLTLPVTNCEGERSFSHMARIKNELRTRMSQQRLNSLAIESDLVRDLDFTEVVEEFSRRKARKKTVA